MIWSVRLLKWKLDGEYETKSFQDYNDGEFVCINIRGKKFIVLRENFERFPDTRLGKLVVKCCNFQLMVLVVRWGVELLSRGWGTATDTLRETHRNSSSTCRLTVIDGWFSSWKTASFLYGFWTDSGGDDLGCSMQLKWWIDAFSHFFVQNCRQGHRSHFLR